jgi:hypothetical protein
MGMSVVPGTVAGNVGMRHSMPLVRNSGAQVPGPDHKRVPEGLSKQLAVLSGLQSVPKDLLVSPARRGSPYLFGNGVPDTLQAQPLLINRSLLVRSVAESVGRLVSNTVLAFAGAWKSSLSLASGTEGVVYNCLSLLGRRLVPAKKGLYLGGLRTCL